MVEPPPAPVLEIACSHPCCRWDQRQLGKSPLTDLNQLIRVTNYTVSNTHTHMLGWWLNDWVIAVPAVLLKELVHVYSTYCLSLSWFPSLWLKFFYSFILFFSCSHSFLVSCYICLWEYFTWRHRERSLGSQPNGFFIVMLQRAFYILLGLIGRLGLHFVH